MSLSNFQKRKIALAFYRYDHNKDGVVKKEDLEFQAKEVAKLKGVTEDSNDYDKILKTYTKVWEAYFEPTTNNLGELTLEAYFDHIAKMNESNEIEAQGNTLNKSIFDVFDLDGNGTISFDEYFIYLKTSGVSKEAAKIAFSKLDLDGDGLIDRSEFAKNLYDYYTKDDPDAVSNWFYGPY